MMKAAENREELPQVLRLAQAEAKAAFGNEHVYIECNLRHPRYMDFLKVLLCV